MEGWPPGDILPNGEHPRRCFLWPDAEDNRIADRFDAAFNAIVAGDMIAAELAIRSVAVSYHVAHRWSICAGPNSATLTWDFGPDDVPEVPRSERANRRFSVALTREVEARDGHRCRYCGLRLLSSEARLKLHKLFPVATAHRRRINTERNQGVSLLFACLDHVEPWSVGGRSDADNLVTCCGRCNYGLGDYSLRRSGFVDPRRYSPVVDDWDGGRRILAVKT